MLTRGRGPSPLRSRTGAAVLAGLFACALLGTAIVRKPAILDLELDILGFVRNFMNYTSDEWYAQEDASKIGAVKATIQRIIALPITPAGRGGVQTPCSGCWGDTSGVCQSEGNQVCYDLVRRGIAPLAPSHVRLPRSCQYHRRRQWSSALAAGA